MPKSTIMSMQRAKEERGESKLSFSQSDELLQRQLGTIIGMRSSLHSASTLFKGRADILPVQCKRVISSLEKLEVDVQQFCELLNDTTRLPTAYKVLRYRLTSVLYLIEEQSSKASELIESFIDICIASPTKMRYQRKEIQESLETLLEYIDDISQRAQSFNYEAHLLQRKLQHAHKEELNSGHDVKGASDKSRLHIVK